MKFSIEGDYSEIIGFVSHALTVLNSEIVEEKDSVQVPQARPELLEDRIEEEVSEDMLKFREAYDELLNKNDSVLAEPEITAKAPEIPGQKGIQLTLAELKNEPFSTRVKTPWDEKEEDADQSSVSPEISAAAPLGDRIKKEDLLIPRFEYDKTIEQSIGRLFFVELSDGRVLLRYFTCTVYTTKEKVSRIPAPIKNGYFNDSGLPSNKKTAIRLYREILSKKDSVPKAPEIPAAREDILEDQKDWMFKPMLKGAFSTRLYDLDGGKIEVPEV